MISKGRIKIGRSFIVAGYRAGPEFGAGADGSLTIGSYVFFNRGVRVYATDSIEIGDHCFIGDNAAIHDSDFHSLEPGVEPRTARISIGSNVWIGRNSIVLPGVTIGDNSVVAAGAVVNSDVNANTLVAGVPAKPIRELNSEDGWVRT